jgi:hypothetical protein
MGTESPTDRGKIVIDARVTSPDRYAVPSVCERLFVGIEPKTCRRDVGSEGDKTDAHGGVLTMHSRKLMPNIDDGCLGCREFIEPEANRLWVLKVPGQSHISRMMPGLGFKQGSVEVGKLGIRNVIFK